jgi:hypothetical protein
LDPLLIPVFTLKEFAQQVGYALQRINEIERKT